MWNPIDVVVPIDVWNMEAIPDLAEDDLAFLWRPSARLAGEALRNRRVDGGFINKNTLVGLKRVLESMFGVVFSFFSSNDIKRLLYLSVSFQAEKGFAQTLESKASICPGVARLGFVGAKNASVNIPCERKLSRWFVMSLIFE